MLSKLGSTTAAQRALVRCCLAGRTNTRAFMRGMSSAKSYKKHLQGQLDEIRAAGTWKSERIITSPQKAVITVARPDGSNQEVINFCANNYLGLSNHPVLVEEAKKYLDSHGLGLSSVRFICGTQDIHRQLERKIAAFHGTPDCILYPSCFDANAGIFEALLTPDDVVISDALNHASLIDGIRLCKAKRERYDHLDLGHLEGLLANAGSARIRMIVTDGVFSMDGDIAPLKEICDLADKYDAIVMVDECHATGFLGHTGRGTPEHCGVMDRVDIVNSTLGKALGGATGGYTAASAEVVQMLKNKSRPYLFSNAVAPSLVGAYLHVFDMLQGGTPLLAQLRANTDLFRSKMKAAGFKLGGLTHPIVPVMIGDAKLATDMADALLTRGIYVIGFSFPVVPRGQARIRVQLSAAHSTAQVEAAIEAFVAVGKEMKII